VADAFDYSHDSRVLNVTAIPELCNDKSWTIMLETRPLADLDAELEHAYDKADLFEKVFKRKLNILVKHETGGLVDGEKVGD
jgi:exopolyphosphatase/guanosine-5'-triphosphate,3'-diphosphate pyrophosphatase